jgi:hypothetical protein
LTRIPDELPVEPQTPDAIIGKLNEVINAGLADPKNEGASCRPWRNGA